ncbi:hypothetical protein CRE_23050 [Caenorhabditis remanei]|uniref:Paired domain-containing protein n=1 Tax=Caenorhabditis remanei TaxID=31234 RepID=E3N9D6_CAERE|nr:hypothetical protein CRE_23050 [Caenorhabditis remanei]
MAPPSPHRSSILKLFKAGVVPVDIIKRLGVPSRTVYDSISRFKKLGTFLDRRGRGRKATVVTPDRIKAVKERIRRNAHRSIRKMAEADLQNIGPARLGPSARPGPARPGPVEKVAGPARAGPARVDGPSRAGTKFCKSA